MIFVGVLSGILYPAEVALLIDICLLPIFSTIIRSDMKRFPAEKVLEESLNGCRTVRVIGGELWGGEEKFLLCC